MIDSPNPLRRAREAIAATRAELAIASGLSARTIEAIERAEFRPSVDTAAALEKALLRMALARFDDVEDAVRAVARLDQAAGVDGRVEASRG